MRHIHWSVAFASVCLAAFAAIAADPSPPVAGPAIMASAPPADITVQDVDGGATIVFKARDAKQIAEVRAFTRQLAEHYKQGCPMMGAGRGKGMGMAGRNCPALATPAPSTP